MRRDALIWTILLLVGAAAIGVRTFAGQMGKVYVVERDGKLVEASPVEPNAVFSSPRTIGLWIGAFFTLSIFSFLYRDNPFYKFAESCVVGVSAAYWMVVAFWTTIIPNVVGKLWPHFIQSWAVPGLKDAPEHIYYIPLALGIILLWRLAPKGAWISRWSLAFIVGATCGVRMLGFLEADFLAQIRNSILPIIATEGGGFNLGASLANVTIVIGVLCGLVYFFFSVEHKGVIGGISRVGIWFLMVTFGAAFGFTVMGRIALFAIRMEFLLDDWLWLIDPQGRRVIETAILGF